MDVHPGEHGCPKFPFHEGLLHPGVLPTAKEVSANINDDVHSAEQMSAEHAQHDAPKVLPAEVSSEQQPAAEEVYANISGDVHRAEVARNLDTHADEERKYSYHALVELQNISGAPDWTSAARIEPATVSWYLSSTEFV